MCKISVQNEEVSKTANMHPILPFGASLIIIRILWFYQTYIVFKCILLCQKSSIQSLWVQNYIPFLSILNI